MRRIRIGWVRAMRLRHGPQAGRGIWGRKARRTQKTQEKRDHATRQISSRNKAGSSKRRHGVAGKHITVPMIQYVPIPCPAQLWRKPPPKRTHREAGRPARGRRSAEEAGRPPGARLNRPAFAMTTPRHRNHGPATPPITTRLALKSGSEVRYPKQQHERLAIREPPKTKTFVETSGLIIKRLDDDGARADEVGRRQGSPACVHDQIASQTPALIVQIHRELSQENHRNRLGHASADARGNPPPFHRAGRKTIERDHPLALADDIRPRAALRLVQTALASQPGVEALYTGVEPRYVMMRIERLRPGYLSHSGLRLRRSLKRSSGSAGASSAARKAS